MAVTAIDFGPLLEALLGLASTAVTAAIPILVIAVLRRFNMANNAELAQRVETAATAGAGAAYKYALDRVDQGAFGNVAVNNAALAYGVNHVLSSLPDTLKTLDITDDHVKQMVSARLGTLLATAPPAVVTTTRMEINPAAPADAPPVAESYQPQDRRPPQWPPDRTSPGMKA